MEGRRTADHSLTGGNHVQAALLGRRACCAGSAGARTFTVALLPLADERAVFATVESRNVVPARARIGSTILELTVRDGDEVSQGQQIALVSDDKLQLQMNWLYSR